MLYRNFTKDNLKVSALGFGCMRFPVIDGDNSKIDEPKAEELLEYAISNGVNFIDTAYPYHGGTSEAFVGRFLKKTGLREKVYLSTKNPVYYAKKHEDFEKYLDEQLTNLKTDYIDFYLLHMLNAKSWKKILELDVFKFIENAKKSGKIKYIGFSFHDGYSLFPKIVDSYNWDFCLIQLNYLDINYQAGLKGLKYATSKNISTMIMEPLKGGKLSNPPEEVLEVFSEFEGSPSSKALSFLYDMKEVSLVLSGMTKMEHVIENIKTASTLLPDTLSKELRESYVKAKQIFDSKIKIDCTSCAYCKTCPQEIAIPEIFGLYNNIFLFGDKDRPKKEYQYYIKKERDASKCVACGICEKACPQNLKIISGLAESRAMLE
ncbi:MAG: aldo/keto reductase [Treponema sp.]|nr:MAG: aldo/keto reductase [Treponema sp.]